MEVILKKLGQDTLSLDEGLRLKAHIAQLEKAAAYGSAYKSGLEKEVLRLAYAFRPEADCNVLKTAVERMELDELREFKKLFEADGHNFLACTPQLACSPKGTAKPENAEFKI